MPVTATVPYVMRLTRLAAVAAGALALSATVAFAGPVSDFLDRYRCPVTARLTSLYNDHSGSYRYLIVSLTKRQTRTITCAFIENGARMSCETAANADPDTQSIPKPVRIGKRGQAALTQLGFVPNETIGTYRAVIGVGSDGDLAQVAELMLSALYAGYGVRKAETGISVIGPPAREDGERVAACMAGGSDAAQKGRPQPPLNTVTVAGAY